MTVSQFAQKQNKTKTRVYQLLKAGRITGACVDSLGNWRISDFAVWPEPLRAGRKVKGAVYFR
jgi:hypothetical protein